MNEDPLANLQPDASGDGGGTPPAPEPPTPPAPEPPVAPVDGTGEDGKLTDEEKAEAEEWDKAIDEFEPGLRKSEDNKGKDDKNEPAKPGEKPKTPEAPADGKKGEEPPKPDGEEKPEDNKPEESEDEPAAPADAIARRSAREQTETVESIKSEVREKMFKDIPTELKDSSGDPIKSIDDLVKLINPRTGVAFTEEEAGMYLLQAQQTLKENTANIEKQIDQIADTQLDIKDQADVINYYYGELLKANPGIRAEIWAEYEKTLTKDPKTGIIIKAPVSLEKFYEIALEPYAKLGRQLEAQETQKTETEQKAEVEAKAAADAKKLQTRQDRSDIYGAGKVDTATEEDKEWAGAADAVFGDQLKNLGGK